MLELTRAVQLLGMGHMHRMGKAYRVGWEEMIRGYCSTHAIHALLKVGFLDELQARAVVDADAFAAAHHLDPEILKALCNALYETQIFKREGTGYALDEKGRLILEEMRGWMEVSYGYLEVFESLEPMLRREKVYGKDFYRKSDYVARGSGAMENWLYFPMANQIVAEKGYRRVLDLGCGDGKFLRQLCKTNPDVLAYGIDLAPDAIEDGRQRAREEGLEGRISLLAGDVRDIREMPEGFNQVNAATIFFVLHELNYVGEQCVLDFLEGFRKSFPGVPLIVFEAIRPTPDEMRAHPGIGVYYYLYHDLTHQKPVDRETWNALFRKAGFTSIEERYLGFAKSAIYILN